MDIERPCWAREVEMAITGGFGMTMDLERGTMRKWVMGRDGVKRWADSGEPVDQCDVPPIGWRCTRGEGHSGPCAAIECPEDVALVERGMRRLRETPNAGDERAPLAGGPLD